jgi:hypothetical protein
MLARSASRFADLQCDLIGGLWHQDTHPQIRLVDAGRVSGIDACTAASSASHRAPSTTSSWRTVTPIRSSIS